MRFLTIFTLCISLGVSAVQHEMHATKSGASAGIRCPANHKWTDKNIALWLKKSEKRIHDVKIARALTNKDLCTMPGQKLAHAFYKLDHPVRPDKPDEAIRFRLQQQSVNGVIKPDGLLNAIQKRKQLIARKTATAAASTVTSPDIDRAHWLKLGPGNIGGRIRTIYIHPTDTNLIFIGSVGGGIWKSTDGGDSWSAVDDFMGNLAVTSIVADPRTVNNVDSTVLYASTGEGFYNIDALRGYGIFKSTDGGETWNHLSSTSPLDDSDWYYVNRLAVNSDGVIMAVASGKAIFTSKDDGTNWTKTDTSYHMRDVDFDPRNNAKAIASTLEGRVLYTNDTGTTWQTSTIVDSSWARVEIAYAESNNTVYASVDKDSGTIYKSTDNGASWIKVSNPQHLGGQGWYANIIWVDPTDKNHLIAGGLDLYESTDGAQNWTKISTWYYNASVHADQHMIIEDPSYDGNTNKRIFFGNDGGIFKTDDITTVNANSSNNGWVNLNHNLAITQFYGGAGMAGSKIVGGAQDNGDLIQDTGTSWRDMYGGDGGFSSIAEQTTQGKYFYFGEYVYLRLHRSDNGADANNIWDNGRLPDANTDANFIAPFMMDPNDPDTLLAGGAQLWRSSNARATDPDNVTWDSIKADTGTHISQIAVAEGNSSIILVGYNNGEIYKTTDGTDNAPTWTKIHDANGKMVLSLMIDKNDTDTFYAGFGGYASSNLQKTIDGGGNWNTISADLPEAPVRAIVRNPNDRNYLYVGTEVGIFISKDGGQNWETDNKGPANVSVEKLFWYDDNTLIAATHGRGMFKYVLSDASNQPPDADAGSDRTVQTNESIDINGSGNDTDGTIQSYQWKEGDIVLASTASFTYTAPDTAGIHTLTLIVTDDDNATDSDEMNVTVTAPANQPPTADAGADQNVTEEETVTLDGSDSNDTDGAIVSYRWQEGNTTLSNAATFTKSNFSVGTHILTLTVTDDDGATDEDTVVVTAQSTGSDTGGGCTYNPHSQSIDFLMMLMMLTALVYPLIRQKKTKPLT